MFKNQKLSKPSLWINQINADMLYFPFVKLRNTIACLV